MFINYIKIAFRNIIKYKANSIINILGLAIGMACTILLMLWAMDELNYDKFHANANNIYRVIQDIHFSNRDTQWAITQGALGPALKKDVPEIAEYVRVFELGRFWKPLITSGEKHFYEHSILGVDHTFFQIFSFPLLEGDVNNFSGDSHSIILTESMARKYFNGNNPVGQVLRLNNEYDFQVAGVLEDIPHNSHLQFDFLVPFEFGKKLGFEIDIWENSQLITYVQLKKDIPFNAAAAVKIADFLKNKPTLEKGTRLILQPLTKIHLYSNYEFDRFGIGDVKYVSIFTIIALFILIIACINYMNLFTARSTIRFKEISMRKVIGAKKQELIYQYLGESFIWTFLALVIAIITVHLIFPVFNSISNKQLSLDFINQTWLLAGLLLIALFTGLLSGSYPAFFLSSLQPISILKGRSNKSGKGTTFRKVLVVIQFTLSVILIIGTLTVYQQQQFMRTTKLGYDKEYIITARLNNEMKKNYAVFKDELLQHTSIINITATSDIPTRGYAFSNDRWNWDGKDPEQHLLMRGLFVDYDYFETFNIEMVNGRKFSREFSSDTSDAIIANETAIRAMGLEEPLGKRLGGGNYMPGIIGIAKDYHFESLHKKIDPLIFIFGSIQSCEYLCIKVKPDRPGETINLISRTWDKYSSDYPFEYTFLDDSLDKLYYAEQHVGNVLRYFTFLALFISSMGLLGLSLFLIRQRTKEIGIRKVLGASVSNIIHVLSGEYIKWVMLANVIAWPVAFYAMNRWLQNFAYRIQLDWITFLIAGILALAVALLTVSYQAIRAANANPVESLRYE